MKTRSHAILTGARDAGAEMLSIIILSTGEPSWAVAERLRDSLTVGVPDVDVHLLASGLVGDERRALFQHASVTILVLTPALLTGGPGTELTDDERSAWADLVGLALTSHVHVIPVLTRGCQWTDIQGASDWAGGLLRYAPVELRHNRWADDVARVVDRVEWHLSEPIVRLDDSAANRSRGLTARLGALAGRLHRWRRQVIPRSRYWRRAARLLQMLALGLFALAGFAAYAYVDHRPDRAIAALEPRLAHGQPLEDTAAVIRSLQEIARSSGARRVVDRVVEDLRTFVLSGPSSDGDARTLRQQAVLALKALRENDLSQDFSGAVLTRSHLFAVDLSGAALKGVSFEDASLEGVLFNKSDLTKASLSAAYVRNGNFSDAIVVGADLTELDWYNAVGFTEAQLQSADPTNIRKCPADASGRHSPDAFREALTREYGMEWMRFAAVDRQQLERLWQDYSRPDGLCERVDRW